MENKTAEQREELNQDWLINTIITGELVRVSDNKELDSFAFETLNKVKTANAANRISSGKRLQKLFERCEQEESNKDKKLYTKYLEEHNYSVKTALRYRNRYNVFKFMNTDDSKAIIASVNDEVITGIKKLTDQKRFELFHELNNGMSKDELIKKILPEQEEENKEVTVKVLQESEKVFHKTFTPETFENLNKSEKAKINKSLKSIIKVYEDKEKRAVKEEVEARLKEERLKIEKEVREKRESETMEPIADSEELSSK